jgi:hypothetical protein
MPVVLIYRRTGRGICIFIIFVDKYTDSPGMTEIIFKRLLTPKEFNAFQVFMSCPLNDVI